MIEISVDKAERVFVRWHDGGLWTVLDRDGAVTEDSTDLGATRWGEDPDGSDSETGSTYDEGFDDGYAEAAQEAEDAISSLSISTGHRRRRVTLKSAAAATAPRPAPRTIQTANVPGGAL